MTILVLCPVSKGSQMGSGILSQSGPRCCDGERVWAGSSVRTLHLRAWPRAWPCASTASVISVQHILLLRHSQLLHTQTHTHSRAWTDLEAEPKSSLALSLTSARGLCEEINRAVSQPNKPQSASDDNSSFSLFAFPWCTKMFQQCRLCLVPVCFPFSLPSSIGNLAQHGMLSASLDRCTPDYF